jgi:hypothetical protein
MHLLAWTGVIVLVAFIGINAGFMMISPKAWFRLPSWMLAKGTLTEKRYTSGWGAIEVRITGALTLGLIAWVVYDALLK